MTEMDYYSALGVDEDEVKGRNQQDLANPVTSEEQGSKDQEVAAPENANDNANDDADTSTVQEEDADTQAKASQSAAENRKYQAARKRAEAETRRVKEQAELAIAQERARVDQQLKQFYATQENQLRDSAMALADKGVDPKNIATIIRSERQKAEREAQYIKAQAENEATQIRNEAQFRTRVDDEMSEINQLDPEITSINDILSKPYAKEFKRKVDNGYSFIDAYKSINMNQIVDKAVSSAQQAAIAKSATKQHLKPATDRGGRNDTPIPPAVKAKFRELMPKATNAEIQKYWNKDKSRKIIKT